MDPHAILDFDGEVHGIPPGYKFQPDDMELIDYYLKPKINGNALPLIPGLIHEVDVYTISPQHLNEKYKREGEHCMYFFTQRNRKYSKENRPNRVVGEFSFWRVTGVDRLIRWNATVIGTRKSLVFFEGKHKEHVKTNWHMQEFTLNNKDKSNHQNVSLVAASSDAHAS
ncbi:NAC transcription factor 29-like [Lotus japonicus]|uniref:NAC transcription factor 29-like n=1 Tax=Lotus japonicus TaxID=34305 RepID=UPI00258764D6|nr:NAC transcription factor 29-like [Lotus japonicus]